MPYPILTSSFSAVSYTYIELRVVFGGGPGYRWGVSGGGGLVGGAAAAGEGGGRVLVAVLLTPQTDLEQEQYSGYIEAHFLPHVDISMSTFAALLPWHVFQILSQNFKFVTDNFIYIKTFLTFKNCK